MPRLIVTVGAALGVLARIISLAWAPQNSYVPDHVSFMGWSEYAFTHGPWRLYELSEGQRLVVRMRDERGINQIVTYPNRHAFNYPPLSAYVFWLQGAAWNLIDTNTVSVPGEPTRRTRIIDTPASRLAGAAPSLIADFWLALGVAALVGAMRPQQARLRQACAFAITLTAPPIFLDSAFWNQADAWIATLLVWCLVFLVKGRWWWAGVAYGAALMTKPQAILLVPLLAFVTLALRFMPGGSWRHAGNTLKSATAAGIAILIIAAPFMLHDARAPSNPAGAWRWFVRSYVETIGADKYDRTTLNAFNLWWIDLMLQRPHASAEWRRAWDTSAPVLGLRKALWGKLLLSAAVLAAGAMCAFRWKWTRPSWVMLTGITLLAAFALPTAVHERYVYFCIPILISLSCYRSVWILPAAAMLLVGTFEMVSFRWLGGIMGDPRAPARLVSLGLAVLAVATLLYSLLALALRPSTILDKRELPYVRP